MDRKRSFQARFERAKTPMGAVPISVIMGFDYPLGDTEQGGRGEVSPPYNTYRSSYGPTYPASLNSSYRDTNMLERIPRPPTHRPPPATASYRSAEHRQYLGRAVTELREKTPVPGYNSFTPSSALEHPKQQPCHYATALSLSPSPVPRHVRAKTVAPSTPSPWRQNTFLARPAPLSRASQYSSQANYNRYSSIRSRFI